VLRPGECLWYEKDIGPVSLREGRRLILHFGAVDERCAVWWNGKLLGKHRNGYISFEFDVTDRVRPDRNRLLVCVRDDTDRGTACCGKQRLHPGGMYYQCQSGIWQTVWLEAVPAAYIKSLRVTPHFDSASVAIGAELSEDQPAYAEFNGVSYRLPAEIPVPDFEPWSPEHPKLYGLTVRCGEDLVQSYFAMRKFSVEKDADGVMRLFLNGKPYFHNGLLDQGYWPDGLYTAPCDEAMVYDISMAKSMGFTMLRKHIKVEPLRWYYHCDRLGMLVWQDMPNGGGSYNPLVISAPLVTGLHLPDHLYSLFARRNVKARAEFREELSGMLRHLYNCPCIAMWVPFNEGWGQFDAAEIVRQIRALDDTRSIDHASGWHDQGVGELRSEHVYFRRYAFRPDKRGRAVLLSEFGGYNHKVSGHVWGGRDFGYRKFDTPAQLQAALEELYAQQIAPAYRQGLAAAVYTQLTDVEDELNGLITYDREVVKIPPETIKSIIKVDK
jgi:beta-galactosidase/beta-glucuronidase